jgi:hypothetical protein
VGWERVVIASLQWFKLLLFQRSEMRWDMCDADFLSDGMGIWQCGKVN